MKLDIEAIKKRHLDPERNRGRTYYEGHIEVDLAACVDEIEHLQRVENGCLELHTAISRIDYLCGEPNEMECSEYDVHGNEEAVVDRIAKLIEEVKLLRAERAATVRWLRLEATKPFEGAAALFVAAKKIERGDHRREE